MNRFRLPNVRLFWFSWVVRSITDPLSGWWSSFLLRVYYIIYLLVSCQNMFYELSVYNCVPSKHSISNVSFIIMFTPQELSPLAQHYTAFTKAYSFLNWANNSMSSNDDLVIIIFLAPNSYICRLKNQLTVTTTLSYISLLYLTPFFQQFSSHSFIPFIFNPSWQYSSYNPRDESQSSGFCKEAG